jgi:hypothetical protein
MLPWERIAVLGLASMSLLINQNIKIFLRVEVKPLEFLSSS